MKIKICPICAGVSLAWLLMTAGILMGQLSITDYQLPVAILMGGTVVGIADKIGKNKFWTIPAGFILVYYAVRFISWTVFGIEIAILGIVAYAYFIMPGKSLKIENDPARVREIEEKLKNCC